MADRIDWIDAAKGAGVLLVVLGHNPGLKADELAGLHHSICFTCSCSLYCPVHW